MDQIKKTTNRNALQQYHSDQRKQYALEFLAKKPMTSREIVATMNVNWDQFKHTLDYLQDSGHLKKSKVSSNGSSITLYTSTGKEFTPRTYDQCLAGLTCKRKSLTDKGMYDDLIASNPNIRVYAGKKSLFDTKPNSYFGKGQMAKGGRGIASTFSMMDGASGFD
jgi:predicted transcriptional regulator